MLADEDRTAMTTDTPAGDQTVAVGDLTQIAEPKTCPVCGAVSPGTEQYCTDCGFLLSETPGEAPAAQATPAVLVDQAGRQFALGMGENSVGREAADVLLPDNTVSRRHACITVSESAVEIEDLGSTNGTEVDGSRVEPGQKVALGDGSVILVGSVRLILKAPGLQAAPAQAAQEETTDWEHGDLPEPVAWLVREDGTEMPVLAGANSIGRREGNDIRIADDQYVSGRHAELKAEDGDFTLVDLGSTNGTFVNGERLEPSTPRPVTPEDDILLGRTALRLKLPESKPQQATSENADNGGG